ncbi:NADPH:quinone reductase [Asanoa hainanensis]|uniref:NADPH:quinone reductase n=1 Tax=Asanoa hainanensis TaxID=560556 RepID=A0A239PBP2_9ACTN|nr:NADP-dependent oxidoreductase [Asanoa hainanensis]SNT64527.1 NADPH:quinone reductase [Asanoa hainanensis]
MYGVIVTAPGGPEVLQVAELPDPVAAPGQVVVRVRAVCVQPADIAARVGMIPGGPVPPPFLPGWDIAGEVDSVGAEVTEFQPGDRVVGMIPWYLTRGTPGGYAELVAADAGWLVRVPDGLDLASAATAPLNAVTAHQALAMLSLADASTVLVTGASGGVGGFAVQLAAQRGHRVLAGATHDDEEWVAALGAAEVIARSTDLATVGPVGAVLDAIPLGDAALPAVADDGIVVTTRPTPPTDRKVRQQLQLIHLDRDVLAELVAAMGAGTLRTRVATTIPLREAAEAHRLVEAGGLRGKVVLTA